MISAVQEQERERQRQRSAASGPVFSVPLMPELSAMPAFSMSSAPSCSVETAPTASPAEAPSLDLTGYLGRSVGSGQCVALVQAANPSLGHTSGWSGGPFVRGNTSLAPGTPIATFNASDRYANALDGSSHAAIYLGQDQKGIQVLDQWAGSAAAVRTIPWNNPSGVAANTGTAFRVVNRA